MILAWTRNHLFLEVGKINIFNSTLNGSIVCQYSEFKIKLRHKHCENIVDHTISFNLVAGVWIDIVKAVILLKLVGYLYNLLKRQNLHVTYLSTFAYIITFMVLLRYACLVLSRLTSKVYYSWISPNCKTIKIVEDGRITYLLTQTSGNSNRP